MAIVKWSGIGQVAGSGKLQGTVLMSNNVIRVWHKTKTVRDAFTNEVKGIFSGISSAFKTLTPTELAAWQSAAVNYIRKNALAEVRQLTANQAFQRVNNIFTSISLAPVTTPPAVAVTDSITNITGVASAGGGTFGLTIDTFNSAVVLPADTYAKVYATTQYTPSKQRFSKSDYRYIGFYNPATSINPLAIATFWTARFGTLVQGQRIGFAVEFVFATATEFKQNQKIYGDVIVGA